MFFQKKEKDKITSFRDLDKMFKFFSDDKFKDFTQKDIDSLGPEEYSYGIQLYFIRQFRRSVNTYIDEAIRKSYFKLKDKFEKELETRIEETISNKLDQRLTK